MIRVAQSTNVGTSEAWAAHQRAPGTVAAIAGPCERRWLSLPLLCLHLFQMATASSRVDSPVMRITGIQQQGSL